MKRLFKTMLFLTLTAVLLAALSACACNGQTATPSPAPTAMTATPAPAPTESILPSPEAPDATPESPASPESSAEPGFAIDYDALKTEVEKLSEIDTCDVVAHGGKAIAGVTFDAQYQGTLTDRIEEMVREKITAKDAGITEVAVTADPRLYSSGRRFNRREEHGRGQPHGHWPNLPEHPPVPQSDRSGQRFDRPEQ